jgi:hypothetical protein
VVNAKPRPLYPLESDTVPIVQEAGWTSMPVWRGMEIVATPGFEPWTVQHAAIRHTDYAVLYVVLFLKSNVLVCNHTENFRIQVNQRW